VSAVRYEMNLYVKRNEDLKVSTDNLEYSRIINL
jgi:hypothetical protein